ncbi:peroxiredoxin-like 2C isoform X2 [Danio rerio]|uniref:Peroxiredoxin-like 2C isoform X2 n=1 Tax=Danio rerio TaxID=7955 RepID=A0A8M3BBJ1_DANRE|nr:thioredoxin-like protein AAED1 isoform X2 [Danio rerio]|eukprot:XP_009301976.1 thioredoxin-like protein AAED1 isoform X2 [Danio rerio]
MAAVHPITRQISSSVQDNKQASHNICLSELKNCFIFDRHGDKKSFSSLFEHNKAIVIFVRHFLCYTCKEYVEDLGKIPQHVLQDSNVRLVVIGQSSYSHIQGFCSLTGFPHEIYVDPERQIYKRLGLRRGETYMETPSVSPHVKSSMLSGSLKSVWRAMTSPVFDFQGDPQQQGPDVHFAHFDMNRLDHMPINWLLQLAGLPALDFSDSPKIINI